MHTIALQPHPDSPPATSAELATLPPAEVPQCLRVAGHELTVFVESPPLLDSMLADILAAKHRVWLEVYIFYNDAGGRKIAEALQQKAREGVDVRVLYDAVGCAATPRSFFNDLAGAGVQTHEYHSLLEGLRRFNFFTLANRRDHRKLLVIDDAAGYFGGMNIIDNVESVAQLKAQSRPASSGWRDVHLRLAGPQQAELADSFERSWRRARGEEVSRRSRDYRRALPLKYTELPVESIHFYDSGPGLKYSRAARVFSRLLRKARRNILISMAYFLPVGQTLRALLRARRRGVRIRIIVPGKSDVPLAQRATTHLYDRLVRRGFRIYERRHRMLHSKVIVVDDTYTLVGSANLDPRSLRINLEFLAVIRSPNLAAIMTRICRFEISQSERITLAHCKQVPWYCRWLNRAAWAFHWFL